MMEDWRTHDLTGVYLFVPEDADALLRCAEFRRTERGRLHYTYANKKMNHLWRWLWSALDYNGMKSATIAVNQDIINAIAHSPKISVALAVVSAITPSNTEEL